METVATLGYQYLYEQRGEAAAIAWWERIRLAFEEHHNP
jgi:hypothetical protein